MVETDPKILIGR